MPKSRIAGRVTRKVAAVATVSAGVLLGGLLAISARAGTSKPVAYKCPEVTHNFTVTLDSPFTMAAVDKAFTVTVSISAPTEPKFPAPATISTGDWIEIKPEVEVASSPSGVNPAPVTTLSASAHPVAPVALGSPMPALPQATLTVTPSPGVTSMVVAAKNFTINVLPAAVTGVSPTPTPLYTCMLATGGNTIPAKLTIPVTTLPTGGGDGSPSPPPPTRTLYTTVTAAAPTEAIGNQVTFTPAGGAATGGGGEIGPDGRVFILVGTALMLAAGAGGLVLRARRPTAQD